MLAAFEKYRMQQKQPAPAPASGALNYGSFRGTWPSPAGSGPGFRYSSLNNPMMNGTIGEYGTPAVFNALGSNFSEVTDNLNAGLGRDPESILYGKSNSQRQFVTIPVPGNVPDTVGFARTLYGVDTNCKAGAIWRGYGITSKDSAVCDGFNSATSGLSRAPSVQSVEPFAPAAPFAPVNGG